MQTDWGQGTQSSWATWKIPGRKCFNDQLPQIPITWSSKEIRRRLKTLCWQISSWHFEYYNEWYFPHHWKDHWKIWSERIINIRAIWGLLKWKNSVID